MNIAIIAPSPVPFVMGGAENLWLGLQRYFNEETSHQCELFKLPITNSSFSEYCVSLRKFAEFDAGSFDLLITTKESAWLTRHRNHSVYMQHPLRGLYDTYHFCKEPTEFQHMDGSLLKFWQELEGLCASKDPTNAPLLAFFDRLENVLSTGAIDSHDIRFPGPLSRKIIHSIDEFALNPIRISRYSAISNTVKQRENYFPKNVEVGVVHHPPYLEDYWCGNDDFLFTASRLDSTKRLDLLVESMRYVKSKIELRIGGSGPDEERLKRLADGDSRIIFLGRLTDSDLLENYANALAVPFVPYDEDYGLITIEAMKSAKPVITVHDAGGVNEFVINGETGLSVAPNPIELAKAIDYLCDNRREAAEMGRRAQRLVANISWQKVAEQLAGSSMLSSKRSRTVRPMEPKRKRMVVTTTFPIYPPRGGGQSRIFNLYREWAKYYDITIVSLAGSGENRFEGEISPGLFEVRIPKSAEHESREAEYSRTVNWIPLTDIVAARIAHLTPDYIASLRNACRKADILVASGPYMVNVLRECGPGIPLWFEAHNVEYKLKQDILPKIATSEPLLQMVLEDEARCWREADLVFACTEKDLVDLEALYGSSSARTLVIPNGFASDEVQFTTPHLREAVKQAIGLQGRPVVIFLGSWHGPNLDAVEYIFEYAKAMPNVAFLIVGSAGLKFMQDTGRPANVKLLGIVDESEKQILLSAADLAVNPMVSGSGSNLKMLDYFAAGVPVLSTPFGARGIDAEPGEHYIVAELNEFMYQIMNFFVQPKPERIMHICREAAALANEHYTWGAIASRAYSTIKQSLG